jgi:hypothetical protein
MNYLFTLKSGNAKTGAIPVTMSSRDTCPDACPLKKTDTVQGCYGDGYPMLMHWNKLPAKENTSLSDLTGKISALPAGQLWRHNQVGDLPGISDVIDSDALNAIVAANIGKKGFTYTHKPMTSANIQAIKRANHFGFTVNLSGNNVQHADYLKSLNAAPVVCILPSSTSVKVQLTPNGNKVVTCPATYRDNISCASCGLCQRADRDYIIGFPAHGASKKKAETV